MPSSPSLIPLFAGGAAESMAVQTPVLLVANATGQTVTIQGTGTSWVNGVTTFSASGVTGAAVTATSINNGSQVATLTVTASTGGASGSIIFSNSLDAATDDLTVIPVATTITLSGPTTGVVGVASGAFTVSVSPPGSGVAAAVTVTAAISPDGSVSGTVMLSANTVDPSGTFTVTPTTEGAHTISTSDTGGLIDPTPLTYTPTNVYVPPLAGLKFLFDAGAVVGSDGSAVSTWPDYGGAAKDAAQGTGALQPALALGANGINGQPAVVVNGDYVVTPSLFDSSYDTAFTIYVVGERTSGTSSQTIVGSASDNFEMRIAGAVPSGPQILTLDPNPLITAMAPNLTTEIKVASALENRFVVSIAYDGAHLHVSANANESQSQARGIASIEATGNMGLTGALTIGAKAAGTSGFVGKIALVAGYSSFHSRATRQAEELRLRQKYGVTPQRAIWALGDSLTLGQGASVQVTKAPSGIAKDLLTIPAHIFNQGIGGTGTDIWQSSSLDDLATPYAVSDRYCIAVLMIGVNDSGPTNAGALMWLRIQDLLTRLRTAGFEKVVVATHAQVGTGKVNLDDAYALIVAEYRTYADALWDVRTLAPFSGNAAAATVQTANALYYSDTTHWTDLGYHDAGVLLADVLNNLAASSGSGRRTLSLSMGIGL